MNVAQPVFTKMYEAQNPSSREQAGLGQGEILSEHGDYTEV